MRSTDEMLNGIDIYSLNLDDAQAPSWAAIRRADFVFVFLKTYEYREDDGTILLSNGAIDQVRTPAHLAYGFANRWPALAKAGFIRGTFDLVHHNAGSATAQATQVARIIQRFVPGDLGPSLDMEDRDLNHSHAKATGLASPMNTWTRSRPRSGASQLSTNHGLTMTAEFGPPPANAPPGPAGRPGRGPMVPGSFLILMVGK